MLVEASIWDNLSALFGDRGHAISNEATARPAQSSTAG
jgi:hypothetical protein